MGVQQPYMYDAVRTEGPQATYHEFDPKAVTRASFQAKPPRRKQEGPLVSFNQHPDSYLILPQERNNAKTMKPSVKKWVKWMRIIQLVLRCFEIIAACGLLVMMILITGVEQGTGWIMRIVPGIALLHALYGLYHLGRKPSGRPPASSASYMLFAAFFDCSIIPFYAFNAFVARTRPAGWKTLLSNQDLTPIFEDVVFCTAIVGGGLHLISTVISLYLAVTFREIAKLPPDMNPLEDNLTSRHKRNKSSVTTMSTVSEKRLSTPLETNRSSGAPYEDLSRPPTIPFFHTRTQSTDSFSTYRSTPPPSRDARLDLPSRQYQVSTSSIVGSDLKRSSQYEACTPPKRGSYTEVPISDARSHHSSRFVENTKLTDPWFVSDSLGRKGRSVSPRKTQDLSAGQENRQYEPLNQPYDSGDDLSNFHAIPHPSPLHSNPASPPPPRHGHNQTPSRDSPLSEVRNTSNNTRYSGDIADRSAVVRELTPAPLRDLKSKAYGELKPGTPPLMVGGKIGRQVSSGNDIGLIAKAGYKREVSGKVAEEGRAHQGFGARFRKISGFGS